MRWPIRETIATHTARIAMVTEIGASDGFSLPCSAFSCSSLSSSDMNFAPLDSVDTCPRRDAQHVYQNFPHSLGIHAGDEALAHCGDGAVDVRVGVRRGDKGRLKLRGREKDAALEHGAKE